MKSAFAILTYKRVDSLKTALSGLLNYSGSSPVAVFEDCGQDDETEDFLMEGSSFVGRDPSYAADIYTREGSFFLGTSNLGVSGNSNRAIRWFTEETDCDHLCLMNDDLEVLGPFHEDYASAHESLGVGLFCFSDFTDPIYRFTTVRSKGVQVKLLTRMTGIMMSLTRKLVEDIGYFDAEQFNKFTNEHCDYTHRARLAGHQNLNKTPQHCLDIPTQHLRSTNVASSLSDGDKRALQEDAVWRIEEAGASYLYRSLYRPYSLRTKPVFAGAVEGLGVRTSHLGGYALVHESA